MTIKKLISIEDQIEQLEVEKQTIGLELFGEDFVDFNKDNDLRYVAYCECGHEWECDEFAYDNEGKEIND